MIARMLAVAAVAALACGCAELPAGGAEVQLLLSVSGAPPGRWEARVIRRDGVVVSELKGSARRAAFAAVASQVRLQGACDPTLDQQPNRIVVTTEPIAGLLMPSEISFEFRCDEELVRLARALDLARPVAEPAASLAVDLGANRCDLAVSALPPALGGRQRSRLTIACERAFGLDDPRLVCGPNNAIVAIGAGRARGESALPAADAIISTAANRVELEVEPLLAADCAISWRLGHWREPGDASLAPVVLWSVSGDGTRADIAYAASPSFEVAVGAAPARACQPACAAGACADDGCGRPCCGGTCEDAVCRPVGDALSGWAADRDGADLVLSLALAVSPEGGLPNDGALLHLRGGGGEWEVFVPTTGAVVALRDGVPHPMEGGVDASGVLTLRVPDAAEGTLWAVVAASPGRGAALTPAVAIEVTAGAAMVRAVTEETVVVGARPSGDGRTRLRGHFPTPLGAGGAPVVADAGFALAAATSQLLLRPRWVLAGTLGWCEALGLCRAAELSPFDSSAGWLAAPARLDTADINQLFSTSLGPIAPVWLGDEPLAAWSDGARTCVAAADHPGDAVRLVIAREDGRAVLLDGGRARGRMVGERGLSALVEPGFAGACAENLAGLSLASVIVGGVQRDGVAAIAVASSGASTVRRAAGASVLVAVWGSAEGWVEEGGALEVFGQVPEGALLRGEGLALALARESGTWRAVAPAGVRSGPVWLEALDGTRSNAVWMPVRGSDSDGGCPGIEDAGEDADGDGVPDACDADADGDGWLDDVDRCPGLWDDQADRDGDDVGDACDRFPDDPREWADLNGNGVGDVSELETCGDGLVSPERGEQCDDGNQVPHDGCEPDCQLPCGAAEGATRAVFDARSGHCFLALGVLMERQQALVACEERDGHLAIPDDALENRAVFAVGGGWLGLDDLAAERTFWTLAQASPSYTAWSANEPTSVVTEGNRRQSCVANVPRSALWEDIECDVRRPVVCERAERMCGDGVPQTTRGETCDDGNRVSGDGCSADCQRE